MTDALPEFRFHEFANIFPLMEGDAFAALVDDVREHGVREPITLLGDAILDGRNRYRAAREAGVRCPVEPYLGDDPLAFVVSSNLHRRHLDESQRAMVAARLAHLPKGLRADHAQICASSQPDAAELLNVGRRSVQHARQVLDHGTPDLQHAVEAGAVSVSAAATVAKLPEEVQAEVLGAGPEAVATVAAEVRRNIRDVFEQHGMSREEAAKVVCDEALKGLRNGTRPKRQNPDYRPNPQYDAALAVADSCDQIADTTAAHGPAFILNGYKDAAQRDRSIQKYRRAQGALAKLISESEENGRT